MQQHPECLPIGGWPGVRMPQQSDAGSGVVLFGESQQAPAHYLLVPFWTV
jgi:hypothetical protein